MIKVLILAYDFPPYVSVGGLRPYSWFKYFHDYGIYPIVVTRQWDNRYRNSLDYIAPSESLDVIEEVTEKGTILRSPYKPNLSNRLLLKYGNNKNIFTRKFVSAYYEFMQYLSFVGPKAELYYAADDYLKNNKVDCIIATAEPYVLLKYASALGKKYNTKWIADYRDPWSQNNHVYKNYFLKKWFSLLEKNIISRAESITTVSAFFEKKISVLANNKPFYIIPNGYDENAIEKAKLVDQESKVLSLAFVGTIYKWHPIKSFLNVISHFIISNPGIEFRVNFYGVSAENELSDMIKSDFSNLKPYIKIHNKIKNDLFLSELAKNNAMVLFNHYSTIGTKIYEFIGLKRLILLCYSHDPEAEELKKKYFNLDEADGTSPQLQTELINQTHSGIVVEDAKHLEVVLQDLYSEFTRHGHIECNSINTDQFSRKIQAQRLVEVIKNIVN
jgi:glycosyltransferase involved in cell wall biosynthesis